ncbi:MAG: hypothetical protein FWC34_05220 [Bacteroidetes bacterium]|nr:hypothetical protein [Bacteroidota bacterium]MCL2302851.1 hypothetical protein [Lentimicrobiaceae bacterium]
MKKLALLIVIMIATYVVAVAQPRAIGGRLGWGVGASYQHGFGEKGMLQADVDFISFSGIQGTATYNWIFPINSWNGSGSWSWYAGVGGGGGYRWWYGKTSLDGINWHNAVASGIGFAGVAGMIGVEYNFKFPLQLSIDWRPLIGADFNGTYSAAYLYEAAAIGVRYKFGGKH